MSPSRRRRDRVRAQVSECLARRVPRRRGAALAGGVETREAPGCVPLAGDYQTGSARVTPRPCLLSRAGLLAAAVHGDEFASLRTSSKIVLAGCHEPRGGGFSNSPVGRRSRGNYTESANTSGRWMLELDEEEERADGWLHKILVDAGASAASLDSNRTMTPKNRSHTRISIRTSRVSMLEQDRWTAHCRILYRV